MFEEYKAFKEKVGVDDVAAYLGYKLDRKAGIGKYVEYNMRDGRGHKIDSIVISHPNDKSSQTYFHRNGASGGDAISLIKENINSFGVTGSSEQELLRAVMSKLDNGCLSVCGRYHFDCAVYLPAARALGNGHSGL